MSIPIRLAEAPLALQRCGGPSLSGVHTQAALVTALCTSSSEVQVFIFHRTGGPCQRIELLFPENVAVVQLGIVSAASQECVGLVIVSKTCSAYAFSIDASSTIHTLNIVASEGVAVPIALHGGAGPKLAALVAWEQLGARWEALVGNGVQQLPLTVDSNSALAQLLLKGSDRLPKAVDAAGVVRVAGRGQVRLDTDNWCDLPGQNSTASSYLVIATPSHDVCAFPLTGSPLENPAHEPTSRLPVVCCVSGGRITFAKAPERWNGSSTQSKSLSAFMLHAVSGVLRPMQRRASMVVHASGTDGEPELGGDSVPGVHLSGTIWTSTDLEGCCFIPGTLQMLYALSGRLHTVDCATAFAASLGTSQEVQSARSVTLALDGAVHSLVMASGTSEKPLLVLQDAFATLYSAPPDEVAAGSIAMAGAQDGEQELEEEMQVGLLENNAQLGFPIN